MQWLCSERMYTAGVDGVGEVSIEELQYRGAHPVMSPYCRKDPESMGRRKERARRRCSHESDKNLGEKGSWGRGVWRVADESGYKNWS